MPKKVGFMETTRWSLFLMKSSGEKNVAVELIDMDRYSLLEHFAKHVMKEPKEKWPQEIGISKIDDDEQKRNVVLKGKEILFDKSTGLENRKKYREIHSNDYEEYRASIKPSVALDIYADAVRAALRDSATWPLYELRRDNGRVVRLDSYSRNAIHAPSEADQESAGALRNLSGYRPQKKLSKDATSSEIRDRFTKRNLDKDVEAVRPETGSR